MMKLMIRLGMMAIALLAMVSCSSSSPSGALEDYMSALQNKKYEKFVDGINISKGRYKLQISYYRSHQKTYISKSARVINIYRCLCIIIKNKLCKLITYLLIYIQCIVINFL